MPTFWLQVRLENDTEVFNWLEKPSLFREKMRLNQKMTLKDLMAASQNGIAAGKSCLLSTGGYHVSRRSPQ
jgi:hypothetical protein